MTGIQFRERNSLGAKICYLVYLSLLGSLLQAATPDRGSSNLASQIVINTRIGELHNAVRYAPQAVIPPELARQATSRRAVFAVDVDVTGYPLDVRVLTSTGSRALDRLLQENLRQ